MNKLARSMWKSCKSKNRYKNEHDANLYRKKCERERGVSLDYYYCDYCNGYHLTSRDFDWEVYLGATS